MGLFNSLLKLTRKEASKVRCIYLYEEKLLVWKDVLLQWDPANYNNVEEVRVPAHMIWTPDIVLYNYADARLREQREALAVISASGMVLWIPMAIYRSTCSIDITNFPFDEQTCNLKFGSWTYDGFKLNLSFYDNLEEVDITDYVASNEWTLLEYPAVRNVKYYPCCIEPYIDLTFTIKVKRMGAFYSYILILPCVLLSFLTLVTFWLPPESSNKMLLGMNIFVAFFWLLRMLAASTPPASKSVPLLGMNIFVAFFLLLRMLATSTPPASSAVPLLGMNIFVAFFLLLRILAASTPPDSRIPLLGAYFCLNMVLITLSTFLSVIIINLYFRQDKNNRVPGWLSRAVGALACMFFMTEEYPMDIRSYQRATPQKPKTEEHTMVTRIAGTKGRKGSKEKRKIKSPILTYNKWEPPPPPSEISTSRTRESPLSTPRLLPIERSPVHQQGIESEVREIRRALRSFYGRLLEKDRAAKMCREWRVVARVLDRMFFFIYLVVIVVSLGTIFPKS